jgi:hypothetical protein
MFDNPFPNKIFTELDLLNLDIWGAALKVKPKFLSPIDAERLFLDTYYKMFYSSSIFVNPSKSFLKNTDKLIEVEDLEEDLVEA